MSRSSIQSDDLGHRGRGLTVLSGALLDLDRRLDRVFVSWAEHLGAREYRFPPCIEAHHLDRLDYFRSFPHLATFPATLDGARENLEAFARADAVAADGHVELGRIAPVEHVLTPAACYHVYVELEGRELDAPHFVTTRATCFRNEASYAPLERQWSFSMREIVCLGTAAEVEDFIGRATSMLDAFVGDTELPVAWQAATDPFFAPASNPKYLFQKLEPVKHELVFGGDLAIASTNFHRDYFGEAFAICRAGAPAFSGCIAFGMERWLAAFLRHHGEAPESWAALGASAS
ncbi:MAG: hypothetical protein R3286_14085 [Gammaproteobacteria bacterium]|nr:hypothetical protein [Gammaproteobacteria bacterium]